MTEPGDALVIVPRGLANVFAWLSTEVLDPHVSVRLDGRTGARAAGAVGVFAVGGGVVATDLRAAVEAKVRRALAAVTSGEA